MVYDSPFLKNRNRIVENEIGFVILDGFPVSEGHCLVIPKRVYADYFESTEEEVIGLQKLVIETKSYLDQNYNPDGYNVGINCGEVSGQTVPHVHIHVIPRYAGDMENPRGGVRGVIPSRQKY
jgi:diadenosine tetraphosphate (Ap4A) HIT family hydrolase